MKRLLLILLFIPFLSLAQTPPKGATAIVLTTNLPDSALFDKTVRYLNANDFRVDKADAKYGTISTDYRGGVGTWSMRILVDVKNSIATFKGQWSATAMGYSFTNELVRNKGMGGSNEKKSFTLLNTVVTGLSKEISGSTVDYTVPAK